MRQFFLATTALIALAACDPSSAKASDQASEVTSADVSQTESERLNAWFDQKFDEHLQSSPISLTYIGLKEKYDQVDDVSFSAQEDRLNRMRADTAEMKSSFDYDLLTDEAKLSWDLWASDLKRAEDAWKWRHHTYIFEQMGGQQTLPADILINLHSVDTKEDAEAYITRISGFATLMNELLSQAKQSAEMGIRPPKFGYEGALVQARAIITGAPFTDGPDAALWEDFQTKTNALVDENTITRDEGDTLIAEAKAAFTGEFKTAYDNLISWLETDIANTADSFGVSELPDGAAFYEYRLKDSTTTDLSADEVHKIGLAEVARLRAEMIPSKEAFGFEGSLDDYITFLRVTKDDERLFFPNTDAGRQGYIDETTDYINNIKTQLPEYFGLLPKADVVVKRVEPFREQDGAAQFYSQGTPDGSRPGVYYAHLSDMTAMAKREMEVTAYHEAIPGHHMQGSIAQELTDIPQFRTQEFFNAYTEGWALYAELLAKEMPGTYQDPLAEFGRLDSEMWRAVRLVLDTGLHAKGWSRQQAIDYFLQNSAISVTQAEAEVERYITWPGQATGYKIGMLKILELRTKAETELGDEFDIRGFHDAVLGGGSLPLDLLEKRVGFWIDSVKADE